MLPSKKTIGIVGAGQLGKMLIEASRPWNIQYATLDAEDASAAHLSTTHIVGKLSDSEKIKELAAISDVITFEIEHIDVDTLENLEKNGKKVIPSATILRIIQDKGLQKEFYRKNAIPTTDFVLVNCPNDWEQALNHLKGNTIAAKSRRDGYDGKGVALISKEAIANKTQIIPFDSPCVLEEFVEDAREISVIVARNEKGEEATYPPCEMRFDPKANLVEFLYAPANISTPMEKEAKELALKTIRAFNGVGIFAVEMFADKNDHLYVNETAPRPHNSGHHTIEACYTSQYEQLNRILLGMPLGDTSLIQPAAMLNILGAEGISGPYEFTGLDAILSIPGVYVHLYNKKETRPWRKMGHVTIMAATLAEVFSKTEQVKKHLGVKSM